MAGVASRLLNDSPERVRVQLPVPPPLLSSEKAIKSAHEILLRAGFRVIRKSKSSIYMKKKNFNHLIRISDHKLQNNDLSKIKYEIVFDYPTINNDIEYRCKSILKFFGG